MASYYIDPTWPGPFNGTEAQPYASWASVPSLVANDFVYFAKGTTHIGQVLYDSSRGASTTLATPITFGSYGSGNAPKILSNNYCIDIQSRNGVIVQDLDCDAITTFSSGGVQVLNSSHVKIQRVLTREKCDYGIRIENTGATLLTNIQVLNNTVSGTYGNTGILLIWGSSVGGVYEDVIIDGNTVINTGSLYTGDFTNTPYGIRTVSKTGPLTTSSGTVDLNLFCRGVQITGNTILNTPAYGIAAVGLNSGGTATIRNEISRNTLINIGNGLYDSHMLWAAGCRDVWIEDNYLDGSRMFQGSHFGTGVGIFIDTFGFTNLFDGTKRCYIRRNTIKNTGGDSAGSVGDLEIAGAGILVFLSNTIEITGNILVGCYNGIGVLGWFGIGLKSFAVIGKGNYILNTIATGITTTKQADQISWIENYIDGYNSSGIYLENVGDYAVTNYSETRNGVVGITSTAYQGGSLPTSDVSPVSERTPSVGNKILSAQYY